MSRPDYIKDIRDALVDESDITDIVPTDDIRVGWKKQKIDFPCIIISQIGGKETPQMGCSKSSEGNRWSKSNPLFRIDVGTRTSLYQANQIMNDIKDLLLGSGYEKMSEFHSYSDKYEAYIHTINVRLTSVYSF
jgi:hypothetical protein